MKTLLVAAGLALALVATHDRAAALEIDEIFTLNSSVDAQTWACDSPEDLRAVLVQSKTYRPNMEIKLPANCGTAVNGSSYKVVKKSDDAVCIGHPNNNKDGKCSWAVIVPYDTTVAAARARDNSLERLKALAGLSRNEYRGCGFVHVASVGYISQQAPEPFACTEAKQEFNDSQDRCVAFVLFTYNRTHRGSLPTNVKGLGMIGCAMLVDNVPEAEARKTTEQLLGWLDLSPALR